LLEVVLPVLTDDACYKKYRVPDKRTGFCAGETGANMDTCQGDSGGPLIVQDNNGLNRGNWTLAGLTSYGRGCGDGGVVTRVSNYYDWIVNNIAANP
jgi:trypsin